MNRYGSRKFIATVLTLASATWLACNHVIASGDYKAVVIGVVAVYIAGNVGQKAVEK